MEEFLIANRWTVTDDPADADLIVIGACASFVPWFDIYATKVRSLAPLGKRLVVYGCLPIVNRPFFDRTTPNVELVIPTRRPELIERVLEHPAVRWSDMPEPSEFRMRDNAEYIPRRRYIAIQYGCSEKCVYCPHKVGIGPERSRPRDEIIKQVRGTVGDGGRIIVLEGSNAGSWGLDLNPKETYAELLREVIANTDGCEIHVGNFAPKWVDRYGKHLRHPRITDIKIPIQTASARLLEVTGRDPYVREMGPLLKDLRKGNDRLVLRTEIIIGLPTETEEELFETLRFVGDHFDRVACFSYDFHPFTKIARMGLPFVDDTVIERRIQSAMAFFQDNPHIMARFDGGEVCLNVPENRNVRERVVERFLGTEVPA